MGRRLEDRRGRAVAVRWQDAAGKGDAFRDPEGRPRWRRCGLETGGLVIDFAEETADPFAKMLLLAAALGG